MHTSEKIETVVSSFLRNGTTIGALGRIERINGGYVVASDGKQVVVRVVKTGWSVQHKDFTGIDRELIVAARNALEACL